MKRDTLIDLIELNFSQRQISEKLKTSQSNVKYWLKKFELKTKLEQCNKKSLLEKFCPKCEDVKSVDNFYKRSRSGYGGYCKKCSNNYHTKRIKEIKIKMIHYKGDECVDCNLHIDNSHYSVFDFHHLNKDDKDINFNRIKFQKWEKIERELSKCVLLCSNCHRLRHAKIEGW